MTLYYLFGQFWTAAHSGIEAQFFLSICADGVIGIEIETAENTAEVYTSSSFMISAPNTGEMVSKFQCILKSLLVQTVYSYANYNNNKYCHT